jgi:hypothetical protein
MAPSRLLPVFLAALLVASAASPATAAPLRRHHRPISAITLTPLGSGTLIRITYVGHVHSFTRILRSRETIDAVAVTDMDADGGQDIVAVREDGDLVLWRHAGRGRFIVAAAPERRLATRREISFQRVRETNAPVQSGDERYSAAMARAPDAGANRFDTPHVARASSLVLSAFSDGSQGRAPPNSLA